MGSQRLKGAHKHVKAVKSVTILKDKGILGISTAPMSLFIKKAGVKVQGQWTHSLSSGAQLCPSFGINPAITTITSWHFSEQATTQNTVTAPDPENILLNFMVITSF